MTTREFDYRGHRVRIIVLGNSILGFEAKAHIIPQAGIAPVFVMLKSTRLYPLEEDAIMAMLNDSENKIDEMLIVQSGKQIA